MNEAAEELLNTPEPSAPEDVLAFLDDHAGAMAEIRSAVRRAAMNAAIVTRGQVREAALRILRRMAERCFRSESDRMVFMNHMADRLGEWMAASSASEN
jgi:hypothetical protein